jgi:hypothetical protein
MQSNFTEASQCLERAFRHRQGSDQFSQRSQQALGLLMGAMLTAENVREKLPATILPFPGTRRAADISRRKPLEAACPQAKIMTLALMQPET